MLRALAERSAAALKDRLAVKEATALAARLATMDPTPAEVQPPCSWDANKPFVRAALLMRNKQ